MGSSWSFLYIGQGIHMLSFVVSTLYQEHSITFMTQFFLLMLNPPIAHPKPLTTSYSGIYIFYCQSYSYCDLVFGNRHLSFDIVIIILLSIDCTTVKLFQLLLI